MGRFLLVKCDCSEESTVYGDSTTQINCPKCGSPIAEPKGGRAKINGRILEVLQ
ncbi:TPA: 30S ribosomal protein S27e [Candidatus Micrarchaeota archaeon]|nr:30S ribosomal protein S27e [Candidatus Micrarchaeota archaeon]